MKKDNTRVLRHLLGLLMPLGLALPVLAQTSTITRVSSFEYDEQGMLVREVIEPDNAQLCLQTTHSYSAQGNPAGTSTAACAFASGHTTASASAARSSTKEYLAQAVNIDGVSYSWPAGVIATRTPHALGQSERYEYDPRHGQKTRLGGPNGGVTTWSYDSFGRKLRESRADGTYTVWEYKLCQPEGQSLDPLCATPVSHAGLTHTLEWYVKEVS
jgi:YD repeat-containing protein